MPQGSLFTFLRPVAQFMPLFQRTAFGTQIFSRELFPGRQAALLTQPVPVVLTFVGGMFEFGTFSSLDMLSCFLSHLALGTLLKHKCSSQERSAFWLAPLPQRVAVARVSFTWCRNSAFQIPGASFLGQEKNSRRGGDLFLL